MTQISPVYKKKVTKESFKDLIKKNQVLKLLAEAHIKKKRKEVEGLMAPNKLRLYENKEKDKCITQLVVKLESIFTSPDIVYLQ